MEKRVQITVEMDEPKRKAFVIATYENNTSMAELVRQLADHFVDDPDRVKKFFSKKKGMKTINYKNK